MRAGPSAGVFAIAMTLLVLNLQVPELAQPTDPTAFATELVGQFPRFFSWLLSFAILCRLWTVHHDLLAAGDTRSSSFVAWNFVFLRAVSFIPYPTTLLAEHMVVFKYCPIENREPEKILENWTDREY